MASSTTKGARVLLTGCTGFVGKVVLESLARRRAELGIDRVFVLVRPGKGKSPRERFASLIQSPCFAKLPPGWHEFCSPVGGDITASGLALSESDAARVRREVTHIIHCAASVEFDLPLAEAAEINVTGALNMLDLARECKELRSFVDVSTAYVTPHREGPIPAELAPLPQDAEELFRAILSGEADEAASLRASGHPNTYTYTKCLAEHLLVGRKGEVPLTIVRPSIVSACRQYPFPGWIDSRAAFAGFAALIGLGHLRVIVADPGACLDIIPCDDVAARVVEAAFRGRPVKGGATPILYAAAGTASRATNREVTDLLLAYFQKHPLPKRAGVELLARDHLLTRAAAFARQEAPALLAEKVLAWQGKGRRSKQAARLAKVLRQLNGVFPYFTHNSFDFQPPMPVHDDGYEIRSYVRTAAAGVMQHLLGRNPRFVPLGGRDAQESGSDLLWVLGRPGNAAVKILAYALRKSMRLGTQLVTYDEAELEKALAAVQPGELVIVAPSHRSYMDFLVYSYLCFARPELGLKLPYIAAAEEFSKVPVFGYLFEKAGAFYIRRGLGKEDPELTGRIKALAEKGETLEFYIEGTRSRGRRMLAPKRGIVRALQGTGQPAAFLPVSITHERVVEENAMLAELHGAPPTRHGLMPILRGAVQLVRGEVQLGRVHVRCGKTLHLQPETDTAEFSRALVSELQSHLSVTEHHLRVFLESHPVNVSLAWLSAALEARGCQVLESDYEDLVVDRTLQRTLESQWMAWLYPEAAAKWPENRAVLGHIKRNGYLPARAADLSGAAIHRVLEALFAPIIRDYAATAEAIERLLLAGARTVHAKQILAGAGGAYLPDVQDALADLETAGLLQRQKETYQILGTVVDFAVYRGQIEASATEGSGSPDPFSISTDRALL